MKIENLLTGQVALLPLYFFVPVTIAGLMVPGYSMVSQQASEITLTHYPTAISILDAGALLTGISIIVFTLGMMMKFGGRVAVSSILLAIFGFSMMSNGIWKMGSPMHGFYGIGFSILLAPAMLAYELKGLFPRPRFFHIAVAVGLLALLYLWSTIAGFDPAQFRGVTQRIFAAITFCWIAYVAIAIRDVSPR